MRKASFVGAVAMMASLLLATPGMAEVAPTETFTIPNESPLTAATATSHRLDVYGWQRL